MIGEADGKLIVEPVAVVENKGWVRHKVWEFSFDLLYLAKGAQVAEREEKDKTGKIFGTVAFTPHIDKRPWMPRKPGELDYTFVDPSVVQRYTAVVQVPLDAEYVLLTSKFKYEDKDSDFHTAQRAFNVRRSIDTMTGQRRDG